MDVPFPQDAVLVALDLDLEAVLGVEQHVVAHLDRPHVGADGHRLGPEQPAGDLGRRRDQDPRP